MTIAEMYNNIVAEKYNLDVFKLLSDSHAIAIKQIRQNLQDIRVNNIVDLAVGTGNMLLAIKELFPYSSLYGIDISQKMLEIASKNIEIVSFHDDALNVGKYMKIHSCDLVILHFLLAYVEPNKIIYEASQILRKGGAISLATSTFESFQMGQYIANNFIPEIDISKQSSTPKTTINLKQLLADNNLKIIAENSLNKQLHFDSFEHFYLWGMNSGWLTHFLSILTPDRVKEVNFQTQHLFPLNDTFHGVVLLAQNNK